MVKVVDGWVVECDDGNVVLDFVFCSYVGFFGDVRVGRLGVLCFVVELFFNYCFF